MIPVVGKSGMIKHLPSIPAELSIADILAPCSLQVFSKTALNITCEEYLRHFSKNMKKIPLTKLLLLVVNTVYIPNQRKYSSVSTATRKGYSL